MTEANFTKKVKRFLDNLPRCWYFKVWGGGFQKSGIPDIVGVVNGRFFALELKADNGVPSDLQIRNIDLINGAGGIGLIVYPNDFKKMVEVLESAGRE